MSGKKERKLDVEDLENRVAPMGVVMVPSDPDPGNPPPSGGPGGAQNLKLSKDQPGRSDDHRARLRRA